MEDVVRRGLLTSCVLAGLIAASASIGLCADAPGDWRSPAWAAARKNPVAPSASSISAGKAVYTANCLACHGAQGKGDGPAAAAFNPRPHDLQDPRIAGESDGELFWKVTEGKAPMPTYRKLLTDADRWSVVNYLRTIAPPPAPPATGP